MQPQTKEKVLKVLFSHHQLEQQQKFTFNALLHSINKPLNFVVGT